MDAVKDNLSDGCSPRSTLSDGDQSDGTIGDGLVASCDAKLSRQQANVYVAKRNRRVCAASKH